MESTSHFAAQYCALNWSIIPLAPHRKYPPKGGTWKDKQSQRATPQELEEQFKHHPTAGVGLVTGKISDLVIIDLDGAEAVEAFSHRYPDAMDTITVRTGSGEGLHLYNKYPAGADRIKTCAGELGQGVDIRGDGGIVVLPPTIHKSGGRYAWGKIDPIEDGLDDLMDMPEDLLKDVLALNDGGTSSARASQGNAGGSVVDLVTLGMGVDQGRRNDACCRLAGHYAHVNGGDFDATLEVVLRWNQLNRPPLDETEIRRTVKSICDAERSKGGGDDGQGGDNPVEKAIDALNEKFAVLTEADKFTILQRTFDRNFRREDFVLKSKDAFYALNANNLVPVAKGGGFEMVNAAALWMKSTRRKEYAQIVFAPGQPREVDDCYNLWYGLDVKPIPGDWSLMRRHIEEVICSKDPELTKWVLCWLARIVQDPGGDRPGTAIALRGGQGTGKTALVKNFGMLFGRHFLHVGQQGHVTGRFNNLLKDKVVVFLDEVIWGQRREAEASALKFMITENTIPIEEKFVSSITVKNHINLILASNSKWAVPAAVDERRFCVIEVSEARKGDRGYFDRLYHQMDHGGREAMLADLLKVNHHQVDLKKIPRTDALAEQAAFSASPIQRFWDDTLYRGHLLYHTIGGHYDDGAVVVDIFDGEPHPTEQIYGSYVKFCQDRGLRQHIDDIRTLAKVIKELCPSAISRRGTTGKKPRCLRFPSLSQCRAEADARMNRTAKWEGAAEAEEDRLAA